MKKLPIVLVLSAAALLASTPDTQAEKSAEIQQAETQSQVYAMLTETLNLFEAALYPTPTNEQNDKEDVDNYLQAIANFADKAHFPINRQMGFIVHSKQLAGGATASPELIASMEALAGNQCPNIWSILAAIAGQDSNLTPEEKAAKMQEHLLRGAQEGSACCMASLAGHYLQTSSPDDRAIADWCAKALAANILLQITHGRSDATTTLALRNTALDYLRNNNGTPALAGMALLLARELGNDEDSTGQETYLLGEALRRIPDDYVEDKKGVCLAIFIDAARKGHPGALNTVADILNSDSEASADQVEQLRKLALMMGYEPSKDYIAGIKTREVNIGIQFHTSYRYLLSESEADELKQHARKIIDRATSPTNKNQISPIGQLALRIMKLLSQPQENPETSTAPSALTVSGPIDNESTILRAALDSYDNPETALSLDDLLSQYAPAHPEHQSIIRVLRLGNLVRVLDDYNQYGLAALQRFLHICDELGEIPGCTATHRESLLRIYSRLKQEAEQVKKP